jgi:Zn-dependent protease with chaperone function
MSETSKGFSSIGFAKTFILPALLVFLVPVLSLLFFLHAQSRFNSEARESVLKQIREDASLAPEEREKAIAFFTEHPFSELLENEEFAAEVDSTARFNFTTFKWLIRLSAWSIIAGIAVFLLTGLCVLLSLRSQRVQYFSLSTGWHVLRIFGALQTLAQGIMLVALSFWVTALWMEVYSVKLILVTGLLAVVGVGAVIVAIFKRTDTKHVIEGKVIDKTATMPLWRELNTICEKVGTAPPDQIIVGIDDNFFVTEHPVIVDGKTLNGRTLYVSLSLLKQMHGAEADAVLSHEMAHFSGDDTLYSKKISPLLDRYGLYLQALYTGGVTRPIFYYMHCFRALFELSLSKLRRQREFRADRIAAETTSSRNFSGAMLRIGAYSKFRDEIQQGLFQQERALEAANISQQIGDGFHGFATRFAADQTAGQVETSHPFDSHPPLVQRLEAVGVKLSPQYASELLSTPGDGRWFERIDNADEIERLQWDEFENQFRKFHEQTLVYRFLPETDEERAIVVAAFPEISIEGKKGTLFVTYESILFPGWTAPIRYQEITKFVLDDHGTLEVQYVRDGSHKQKIPMKSFGARQQEAIDAINRYYSRYMHAAAYQEEKRQAAKAGENQL